MYFEIPVHQGCIVSVVVSKVYQCRCGHDDFKQSRSEAEQREVSAHEKAEKVTESYNISVFINFG